MITRSVVIALIGLGIAGSQAVACSCSDGGPRNARRRSVAVYLGRVVEMGRVRRGPIVSHRLTRLVVTVAIKGVRAADTVAVDAEIGNSCAVELQLGAEYLVYAIGDSRDGAPPVTDYCAGTTTIACAADDLRALGARVPRRARSCRPAPPPPPAIRLHGLLRHSTRRYRSHSGAHAKLDSLNHERIPIPSCLTKERHWRSVSDSVLLSLFPSPYGRTAFHKRYGDRSMFALISKPLLSGDTATIVVAVAGGVLAGRGVLLQFLRGPDGHWVKRAEAQLWVS